MCKKTQSYISEREAEGMKLTSTTHGWIGIGAESIGANLLNPAPPLPANPSYSMGTRTVRHSQS